jgi:2-keto-3-deoxy-L-rhamnonate aldolase RhmA
MWEHPVRQRLQQGLPVLASTVTTANPEVAAHMAGLGFHLLWVEMEHSPITLETLRLMVLATRGLPAAIFARVPVNDLWTAKRVLDQGVSGVIFPFTRTPELAKQAAGACHYPPRGLRGAGANLAIATWPEKETPYYDSADRNVVVVAVVEDQAGLENVDAIAATPGIDVIFIGTTDLSFSLGLRGRQDEPEHRAAVERIVAAARRHGKAAGRPAADAAKIAEYMEQGFLFFQTSTELGLLSAGARQLLEPLGLQPAAPVQPRALY